ncbi:sulfate permease [Neolentinus lepideus HHB14362 ss-1]|uniref:Sulfate permease n=1 Tax=Neolentinus lepideus HHB14362 ss-1 TaxID=1314782 RepID=A0A165QJS5_9AGAM|nr:sulfate permease [Neolentinus lepideus HHB14362 ss-1]
MNPHDNGGNITPVSPTAVSSPQTQFFSRAPSTRSVPGMVTGTRAEGETSTLLPGQQRGETLYGGVQSDTSSDVHATPQKREKASYWAKVRYYIPSMAWIPNYSFSLLGGDVLAGVTVACMLIPQSVSYATSLAKLSPVAGLFSASIPGIIYALLGTSRQLNVAPEAALSLLVGQAVSDIIHGDPHSHPENSDAIGIAVSTIITFQVGLISFLLGFFRLGFIDVVLSRALLRGFITAVAVVIMIEQLIPMFGLVHAEHVANPKTTLEKFFFLVEHIPKCHELTTLISFGALGVLILLRTIKAGFKKYWFIYRLPEVLVVVVLSTVMSQELDWDDDGVAVLGSVNTKIGNHFFRLPFRHKNLSYLRSTTSTAILCSVIGYLDSIVSAKQNAGRFGYSISPNRELVALGAGNLMGSFVPGTLPAFGSITRSRINGEVGGRTQMASLICSAIVLLATFFLLPLLYHLPTCVLASIIAMVVFSLLAETPHDVRYYWKMRSWIDLGLMFLTFTLTIIWNIEIGITVSLIISLLLVVHRSSKPKMTILGRIPGTETWKPINENPDAREDVPGVLILRIRENLDFANTAQLKERLRRIELYGAEPSHPSEEPRRQEATVLIFHMADVDSCDASAAQIFYELLETYKNRDVELFIAHLKKGPREVFERAGIVKLLGEDAFQENVGAAMARIGRRYYLA